MSGGPAPTPGYVRAAARVVEAVETVAKPVEKFAVQGRAISEGVKRMTGRSDIRDTNRRGGQ